MKTETELKEIFVKIIGNKNEIQVRTIKANDRGCIGCQKMKKDIMITYSEKECQLPIT